MKFHGILLCIWFPWTPPVLTLVEFKTYNFIPLSSLMLSYIQSNSMHIIFIHDLGDVARFAWVVPSAGRWASSFNQWSVRWKIWQSHWVSCINVLWYVQVSIHRLQQPEAQSRKGGWEPLRSFSFSVFSDSLTWLLQAAGHELTQPKARACTLEKLMLNL